MRRRLTLLLLPVLLVALAPPASAQDDHSDEEPPTSLATPGPGEVGIGDNIFATGATITALDGSAEPRELDAYQAAVFLQSWFGSAFFDLEGDAEPPPAGTTLYQVDTQGRIGPAEGTITVYYAEVEGRPFVATSGILVRAEGDPAPPPSDWLAAQPRVVDAFNGDAELLETTGVQNATGENTTTTTTEADAEDDAGGSSSSTWIVLVAGVVVVAAAAGFVLARRRRGASREDGDEDPAPERVSSEP